MKFWLWANCILKRSTMAASNDIVAQKTGISSLSAGDRRHEA